MFIGEAEREVTTREVCSQVQTERDDDSRDYNGDGLTAGDIAYGSKLSSQNMLNDVNGNIIKIDRENLENIKLYSAVLKINTAEDGGPQATAAIVLFN